MLKTNFVDIFKIKKDPFDDIVGQDSSKEQLKSALLVGRHVLIIGPPGIGKTTLAKNLAKLLPDIVVNDCPYHCLPENPICPECISKKHKKKKISGEERFVRVQGSPDLTAEDLIGDIDPIKAFKFGPLSIEAFTPGKIFKANNGILFFDELNRCPEKLQNALLQVLQEGVATIGSYDVDIKADFIFIGTMNPKDSSTEKLSDVLLDRFDIVYMSYPETFDNELKIVKQKGKKLDILFPDDVLGIAIHFVRALRENKNLEKLPSVRASIGLYERAQANAFLKNKQKVDFSDVEEAMVSVLSHRIKLKPIAEYSNTTAEFVKEELKTFIKNFKHSEKGGFT
ncbi:MAG: ATP-binding protein [Candidatus Woesearchaeota archaeon]